MDTSNGNGDHDSHVAVQTEDDDTYMPPSPSMSESSMIFERNVEDPSYLYKTVSNNAANPLSRQSSRTSLFNHNNTSNRNIHNLSQKSSAVNLHLQPSRTNESIASYQTYNPDFIVQTPLDHRRTLENFVPPALDAGCSIVTDETTGLDDVDMVYSRRPSTIGLDKALGRTRSLSSQSFENETSPAHPRSPNEHGSRLLRFYSYADMLSDDNNINNNNNTTTTPSSANPLRRPPMQNHYSFSSSIMNSPSHLPSPPSASASPPQHMSFTNPFIISRRYSNTTINNASGAGSGGNSAGAVLSRSPSNQQYLLKQQRSPSGTGHSRKNSNRPGSATNIMIGKPKSKFHIESSGSEGFSSEEEDNDTISRGKLHLKQKLESQLAPSPSIAVNTTNHNNNNNNNSNKNNPAFLNSNPSSKSNSNSTITAMNPSAAK
ncbi:hypothetical protein SUVZ_09G0340 [Saccharomyces uvarum]|uniref:Vhs2p n=1 Tax=Saccharomyces uvarum TaxID=230603 RepID=A0ABN8WVK3_SACUV|nr:hypothetical protein SUVZ_09G0340 [Saccharomyces uvarum]